MRLLISAAALLMFTVHADRAHACSCAASGPPCQGYFQVDAVFAGTVTAISDLDGTGDDRLFERRLVRFATQRAFRGVEGTTVDVFTGMGGGDCGYAFKTGEQYLVYASRRQGRLTTGICSRTRPLAEAAEDLKFIQGIGAAPAGARVSGTIAHSERDFGTGESRRYPAVADVPVQLRGTGITREARTDESGRYDITGVPPGKYEVQVFPPPAFSSKYLQSEIDIPDARACAVADFGVHYDGRVTGVLRSSSGQPVGGVTVQLMAAERADPRRPAETVSAKTDSAGYYQLADLPPGEYVAGVELQRRMENDGEQIHPRTFYPGTSDVSRAAVIRIGEGNLVELEPMVLPAARQRRELTGVVVWPDGTPVAGAFISLTDGEAGWRQVAVAIKTDDQGRFTFTVHDGLSYVARAFYSMPDDPAPRQANGVSSAFVVSEKTPPLRVVVTPVAPRR